MVYKLLGEVTMRLNMKVMRGKAECMQLTVLHNFICYVT